MEGGREWKQWREVGNGKNGGRWGAGRMEEGGEQEGEREIRNGKEGGR